MVLPVLLGVPLGALLNWASDVAPCLAAPATKSSTGESSCKRLGEARPFGRSKARAAPGPGWRDVVVVIATSGLLAILELRFDPFWTELPVVGVSLFLLLIALVDLKHRLILNGMVLPAAGLVLLARIAGSGNTLVPALLGAVVGAMPFLLTALVKPNGMGGGDVKLAGLIGLALGFPGVLWAVTLGIFTGGVVSLLLLSSPEWKGSDHLPYGPFLCLGAITALLYDPVTPMLWSIFP